jgi:hypothetical protein
LYILQWCFNLTISLFLAAATAGISADCSTVLDILTFVLRLVGIVTGHVALSRFKNSAGVIDRSRAIGGLMLGYFGSSFGIIAGVGNLLLVAAGIGRGLLYKAFPFINK